MEELFVEFCIRVLELVVEFKMSIVEFEADVKFVVELLEFVL